MVRAAKTKGWSEINVDVAMSDQFLGWIFALGDKVRITTHKCAIMAGYIYTAFHVHKVEHQNIL